MVTYVFLCSTWQGQQVYIVYKLCWNSLKYYVLPLPWTTTRCRWGQRVSWWWVNVKKRKIEGGMKGIKREKSKECYCFLGRCWWLPCGFFFLSSFTWHSPDDQLARFDLSFCHVRGRMVRYCTEEFSSNLGVCGFLWAAAWLSAGAVTGRKKGIFSLLRLKKQRQKANHIGWGAVSFSSLIREKMSWQQRVFFFSFLLTILSDSSLPNWKKKPFGRDLVDGSTGCLAPATQHWRARDRRPFRSIASLFFSRAKKEEQETERLRSPARNLHSGCCSIDPTDVSHLLMGDTSLLPCPAAGRWSKCIGSRCVWSMGDDECTSTLYSTCCLLLFSLLFYFNSLILFHLQWKLNYLTIFNWRNVILIKLGHWKCTELNFDI